MDEYSDPLSPESQHRDRIRAARAPAPAPAPASGPDTKPAPFPEPPSVSPELEELRRQNRLLAEQIRATRHADTTIINPVRVLILLGLILFIIAMFA